MILITGGCGFIGSNLVEHLNKLDIDELCIADRFSDKKKGNIAKRTDIRVIKSVQIRNFLNINKKTVKLIIHLGAKSSTTEINSRSIVENNIELSLYLWNWCAFYKKRFIYASSAATYGNGEFGFNDFHSLKYLSKLRPLNLYGWSKHLIDKYFINEYLNKKMPTQWVGLKFFNVYGPNEYHKGNMQSVVYKIFDKIKKKKKVNLFKSHNSKYLNGEQLRDFIYVKDVVKIIVWFINNKNFSGIFNAGSGNARSFNDLADYVFKYSNTKKKINFIDTPVNIRAKYQYFTQANINKLIKVGYNERFYSLEEGINEYVTNFLLKKDNYL